MRNKVAFALLTCAGAAWAQEQQLDLSNSVKFNLPPDSPVAFVTADFNSSRATVRGGAATLDLHIDLSLRNAGYNRVRGITMLVVAQEASAFGKASVARLIDAAPGETFPLRIDVRLVRPVASSGPLVQVNLDGVLFDNLAFYGPNRLNSKRSMTFWETEARRDRLYFKQVLSMSGPAGLQKEMQASLLRQAEANRLDVRMSRSRTGAEQPGQMSQFAFLENAESPVRAVRGFAMTSGGEVRSPEIEVLNRSNKPVRYVEIAWLVKDPSGQQFLAGSVPAAGPDLYLPPGQRGQLQQDSSLRFSRPNGGAPVTVQQMTGVVSEVEFSDGKVWVPRRETLSASGLLTVLAPSPEEQRLSDLYRTRGVNALIEELKRF